MLDENFSRIYGHSKKAGQAVKSAEYYRFPIMNVSFSEYSAAMIGCYSSLPAHERDSLHAWESEHVNGSGVYGTSDWPGWEKYTGKFHPPAPKELNTFGYVYLIQSDTGRCKIGSSQSVGRRIKQLQSANPGTLVLIHQYPSANAQFEERALHKRFHHRRVRNEWFALTDADIASICSIKPSDDGGQRGSIFDH